MALYNDSEITFLMGHVRFHASNFFYGTFQTPLPEHSHGSGSYELHYIPYGNGLLKIKNSTYQIVPNTLFVTGPHIPHTQIPVPENPMTEYSIYLRTEPLPCSAVSDAREKKLVSDFLAVPFWFNQDKQNIHQLFQDIFLELHHQNTGYLFKIKAQLQQLIISLIRNYGEEKTIISTARDLKPIANAPLIIEESFLYEYDTITLNTLAFRLGLSPRQTERLVKNTYHRTFLQKRTQARMAAAVTLLSDLNLSITDISERLGYSCVEHFSDAFRRYFGMSARAYRKNTFNETSLPP